MHLKNLELVGFKSFAERTLLDFNTGISAIVGPNGCGKSNISDAIRWVLGEQSARLLRGTKMEDCIFNGTDIIPPKNLAEVSLTLTDCEKVLGTDYHEVTVTRRVFRSGEGQYFINKTPCRLKDIQRLFMDTGLGTNSYSVMEQGKIDLILRARPEDRREVFEEASGITKYKADKREAMRKLEQTESNLLRLADIIKEVKRQIISIQRQAGKAERYRKLYEQLRAFDVYAAKERLQIMAAEMNTLETRQAAGLEKSEAVQQEIERQELDHRRLHDQRAKNETDISALQQAAVQLDAQMEQLRQAGEMNRQRLKEHQELIQHDSAEIKAATAELEQTRATIAQGSAKLEKAALKLSGAESNLKDKSAQNARMEEQLDRARHSIQQLLTESLELEDRLTKSQNELHQLENSERGALMRRERCSAEQANLRLVLEKQQQRVAGAEQTARQMAQDSAAAEQNRQAGLQDRRDHDEKIARAQTELGELEKAASALAAQLEMLKAEINAAPAAPAAGEGAPAEPDLPGLDPADLLGKLRAQLEVPAACELAFEAVLRDYLPALIIKDLDKAFKLLKALEKGKNISLSMLVADLPSSPAPVLNRSWPGVGLIEKIKCREQFRPLLTRLLHNVCLIESVDHLKQQLDPAVIYVTPGGAIIRGTGALQVGLPRDSAAGKQKLRDELAAQLAAQHEKIAQASHAFRELTARKQQKQETVEKADAELDEKRQNLARQQGQLAVFKAEADQVGDNLETVTWELKEIEKQGSFTERKSELITGMDAARARRVAVKHNLEELNGSVKTLDQTHRELQAEVMAANVNVVQYREEVEHLGQMGATLKDRIAQLETTVAGRTRRIRDYEATMETLRAAGLAADQRGPRLKEQKEKNAGELAQIQAQRDRLLTTCQQAEDNLKRLRANFEAQRNQQSDLNGKIIELRMRREHLLERVTGEYHLAPEAVNQAAEPVWPAEGRLSAEQLDAQIAELRAKIDAMGSVNTGAIEELQQLQERHEFLSRQQDDLVRARQQLLEAIRKINQTTTEMFAKTFAQINENFQVMFSQLFGGGSAKLILTDEGDILECGVEIYARPPGKRLQSISLLSGGESTMTAVALLFAIFMVKPSPFCMLDELDAALDDANNQRFINMLKNFLKDSQFVVITHNRQTIAAAGVLYGVTMEKDKVSTIVSMRFNSSGKPEPVASPPEQAVLTAKN